MKANKKLLVTVLGGALALSGGVFAEDMSKEKSCDKGESMHGMMSGGHHDDDMSGMGMMMGGHGMGGHGGGSQDHAGMGMGMGSMGGNYGMSEIMPMLHGMDLTADQQTKLRAIMKDLRNKHMTLSMKRFDIVDDLEAAYGSSDQPDPVKIGELYGKIFEVRKDMIQSALEAKNKVADILTPEQREIYNAHRRDMGKRMMQH